MTVISDLATMSYITGLMRMDYSLVIRIRFNTLKTSSSESWRRLTSMCRMLLSINPEYVNKIFNGSKKYEFRKVKCRSNVDSILIYETAPVMKVVGEATIKRIITGKPSDIWKETKTGSGISKTFFDLYYGNRDYAVGLIFPASFCFLK